MENFTIGASIYWKNGGKEYNGILLELRNFYAIIDLNGKNVKIPYKVMEKYNIDLEKDEDKCENEDLLRAQSIAKSGFDSGRNPLDTADMDSDDEEWLGMNPDWSDYIMDYYLSLKKEEGEEFDFAKIKDDLSKYGFCVVEGVLSKDEIEYSKTVFKEWQGNIINHDEFHKACNPNNIYKYHRVGHTKMAWFIRTRSKVQNIFKEVWNTDELVVSFDGACYMKSDVKNNNKLWTHVDQGAENSELQCYQGFVSLTDNTQKTLRVYEGSHLLHKSYFEEKGLKKTGNWNLIDKDYLDKIEDKKRVLNVPAGSLVLWDSRCFHQNQIGDDNGEERLVQYVCYLPKSHPKNTDSMKKKRLKYLEEQRTTSHWPYPIKVNGLQPRTFGNDDILIDYDSLPMNDLSEYKEQIMKII